MQSSILNKVKSRVLLVHCSHPVLVTPKERCSIRPATETVSVTNIEQYKDVNKSVSKLDGSLQCSVMFNALIRGKWYPIW